MAQPALSTTKFTRSESGNPDASTQEQPGIPGRELAALRRLTAFSERLLSSYEKESIARSKA